MPLSKVVILSFIAIITMVNPLAVIPSFVALTGEASRRARASVAFVASIACIVVLTVFLLIGSRGRLVFAKIMSLLLGAIGIQFIINGVKPVMLEIMRAG